MKMPFGKYKGHEINTLSYGYCSTLLEHIPIKDKQLKAALEKQMNNKYDEKRREANWANVHDYGTDGWWEDGREMDETYGFDMGDFC